MHEDKQEINPANLVKTHSRFTNPSLVIFRKLKNPSVKLRNCFNELENLNLRVRNRDFVEYIHSRKVYWYSAYTALWFFNRKRKICVPNRFSRKRFLFDIYSSYSSSFSPLVYKRFLTKTFRGYKYLNVPVQMGSDNFFSFFQHSQFVKYWKFFRNLPPRYLVSLIEDHVPLQGENQIVSVYNRNLSAIRDEFFTDFFFAANHYLLRFSTYKITRDIKSLLGFNVDSLVFVSLSPHELTPQLFARFTTRRLSQRFSLFETIKVLRKYLHSCSLRGYLIKCSGRFTKKQRASIYTVRKGSAPNSTWSAPVQYYDSHVKLKYGACCIKVWTYR